MNETPAPQRGTVHSRVVVRIEGVNAVVLRGHVHHVVTAEAGNGDVGHVKRLRVNVTIHGVRKKLTKAGSSNIVWRQNGLVQVLAVAAIVVARGGNAHLSVNRKEECGEEHQNIPND
jgi:hypothetical protein